jgi:pimeloyl-ACP methyl ester carboxylesterase
MPVAHHICYAESPNANPARPPVVLVHGAGGDSHSWPVEIRRLSGWRVLAVDLPGHGRSKGRPRQSVAETCHDLLDFLGELKIFRAVLVGHSLGAAVVLQLAEEFPDRLAGLGLISATAHLDAPPLLVDYFSNPLTVPLGIQLFQQWAFCASTPPARVKAGLTSLHAARPAALAGDWQAFARFDFHGSLERVTTPAWIASGAEDRLAPPASAHYLASHLSKASVQVIPSAGHMLLAEQPAALAAGLQAFLQKLSPGETTRRTAPLAPGAPFSG